MTERPYPEAPVVPEAPIVVGAALAGGAMLAAQGVWGFGAGPGAWPGLAAGAVAILFVGLAVLAGAPAGWRWVGATVCLHLGLHPWLAYESARHPLTALSVALVALLAWVALGLAADRRLQGLPGALFLAVLCGLGALVRPDLIALAVPLAALALWLADPTLRPGRALVAFALAVPVAVAAGLAVRWQVFSLDSVWTPGAARPFAEFLRVNAVGATAGLAALALLGKPAWRQALTLYGPLLAFAGLSVWIAPSLPGAQALHLPLLPLLAIAFAVLLARALDALPAIRPRDDLGKTAALILGLIYVAHLLAVDTGQAPPAPTTAAA